MDQLRDELSISNPEFDIAILGVNGVFNAPGNKATTDGRDSPWLQDVSDAVNGMSVKDAWGAELRDVVIVGADNALAGRYNLTANDLANPANYAELRDLFVEIASTPTDPSSLSGHVYFDVNNNGVMDPTESMIGNVQVTLTGESGQQSVMTEADGSYAFYGLGAGTYTVTQSQPALVLDGIDTLGSAGGEVRNDQFVVQLQAGTSGDGYNFGELGREAATISLVDLLATPADGGLVTTVEKNSGEHWFSLQGDWTEYHYAHVELASDNANAIVSTRDIHGHDFEAAVDLTQSQGGMTLAENASHTMMRIVGPLIDLTANNQPSGEGEFHQMSRYLGETALEPVLIGEGETQPLWGPLLPDGAWALEVESYAAAMSRRIDDAHTSPAGFVDGEVMMVDRLLNDTNWLFGPTL